MDGQFHDLKARLTSPDDYLAVAAYIRHQKPEQRISLFRAFCRHDLFYLLLIGCQNPWILSSTKLARWTLDRCREVEASPNGHLDLWAREHMKSTIITFALTIQDLLRGHGEGADLGYEPTVCIFSFTRPIAKAFLAQIMQEFESNEALQEGFPDIFWEKPSDAPKWGLDQGIVLRRSGNPREATVEAWGLVDGQPTSKHFTHRIYDDVVTKETVNTPEQIEKTVFSWELSLNLANSEHNIERYIGTRYAYADPYEDLMQRGAVEPRVYPATHNGQFAGQPVMWSDEVWSEKARKMGSRTAGAQLLQDPGKGEAAQLKRTWIKRYTDARGGEGMFVVLIVDPASKKKRESDHTAMSVIGLGQDGNYYLLDVVRDKLKLKERWETLKALHFEWNPSLVVYEEYGLQADIEYFEEKMEAENYRFRIVPIGGKLSKIERIEWLIPRASVGRWWMPHEIWRENWEGRQVDMLKEFLEKEWDRFPLGKFDVLDSISRIHDPQLKSLLQWPKPPDANRVRRQRYGEPDRAVSWRRL